MVARLFAEHFQAYENEQRQAEAAAEKPDQKSRASGSNDGVHELEDEWNNHARWIARAARVDVSLRRPILTLAAESRGTKSSACECAFTPRYATAELRGFESRDSSVRAGKVVTVRPKALPWAGLLPGLRPCI